MLVAVFQNEENEIYKSFTAKNDEISFYPMFHFPQLRENLS